MPNPKNPRRKASAEELAELCQSIKSVGLLQPITVRPQVVATNECPVADMYYEIVCGHRRFEAAKMAGLEEITCIVRVLSDEQAYEIMVTENLQRKDIDPFDEAAAFSGLKNRGYDVQSLADKFGKSASYIYGRIRLTNLIPEFVEKYEAGGISYSHCAEICKVDGSMQRRILKDYYSGGFMDLSEKGVAALKSTIFSISITLDNQPFDTTECKNCSHNTGSDAIFPDMCVSKCTNVDCISKKYTYFAYPHFVAAREKNTNFFIIDDWKLNNLESYKQPLVEKLREDGFPFQKVSEWDYECGAAIGESCDMPACFSFSYNRMMTERESVEEQNTMPAQRKNDWRLDRLASEREDRLKELSDKIAFNRIPELDFPDNMVSIEHLFRAILLHLAYDNVSNAKILGVYDCSDVEKIKNVLFKTGYNQLAGAVSKILVGELYDGYDSTFLRLVYPEAFEGTEDEAKTRFMDECRKNWIGYDNVTDEMIEADLAERLKKEEDEK